MAKEAGRAGMIVRTLAKAIELAIDACLLSIGVGASGEPSNVACVTIISCHLFVQAIDVCSCYQTRSSGWRSQASGKQIMYCQFVFQA